MLALQRETTGSGVFLRLIGVGGAKLFLPLSLTIGAPAFAQPRASSPPPAASIPEIRPGVPVRSTLDSSDATIGGRHFEDFRLTLTEGQVVQIDMESPPPTPSDVATPAGEPPPNSFDTFLEIRRPDSDTPVAENDDRPGSLNSRLVFTAPPGGGEYVVRARVFFRGTGDYLLSVTDMQRAPDPIPFDGNSAQGVFGSASPVSQINGVDYHYSLRSFDGTGGDRVALDMTSGSGGTLQLIDESGQVVARAFGGTRGETHLLAGLSRTGRYIVRAEVPATADGPYAVTLLRVPRPPQPQPRRIRIGQVVEEQLTLARSGARIRPGGSLEIDSFYELYELEVEQGQTLTVTLEAVNAGFDPVLDAGGMSVLGFSPYVSDDDSGGMLNARLVLRPITPGLLYLRARSLGRQLGTFRLTVAEGEPRLTEAVARPPGAQPDPAATPPPE